MTSHVIAVFIFNALRISHLMDLRCVYTGNKKSLLEILEYRTWTRNEMQKWRSGEYMWPETEQLLWSAHANGPHKNVRMACMQKYTRGWISVNHKKIERGFMWNIEHVLGQIANILWHITWKWKNKSQAYFWISLIILYVPDDQINLHKKSSQKRPTKVC